MRVAVLLLPLVLVACISPMAVEPMSVPLQYKAMADSDEYDKLSDCAALSDIRVTDTRTDKTLGKRYIQGVSEPWADVTTDSNVAAWVASGVVEGMKNAGASMAIDGKPVLHISVDEVSTKENVYFAGGYEAHVVISGELVGKNGKSCWKDRVQGAGENYGYAGHIDNYQETLNHALDRAVIEMVISLQSDICDCGEGEGGDSETKLSFGPSDVRRSVHDAGGR